VGEKELDSAREWDEELKKSREIDENQAGDGAWRATSAGQR
jgi:hypothetical protein